MSTTETFQNKPEKVRKTRSNKKINPAGETIVKLVDTETMPEEIKKEISYSEATKKAEKRPMSEKQKANVLILVEKNKIRYANLKLQKEELKLQNELIEKERVENELKLNNKNDKVKLIKMTTIIKPKAVYKPRVSKKIFPLKNDELTTTADEETTVDEGETSEDSRHIRRLTRKVHKIDRVLKAVPEHNRTTCIFSDALNRVF